MNFRRTIAKTMVFALALGMFSFTSPNSAKAAAPSVTFDGEKEVIAAGGAKYWAVAKSLTDSKKANLIITGTNLQVGTIEPVIGDAVDVSNLKKNKDLYLVFGSTDDLSQTAEWKMLKIPAQAKDLTVQYVTDSANADGKKAGTAEGGFLILQKNKTSVDLAGVKNKYMAKIGDGSWAKFETTFGENASAIGTKLQSLAQLGAELKIREAGSATDWSSKEAKVKISTRGKAPSVKIDPVKGTVSVKTGMEFVVPKDGTSTIGGGEAFAKIEKSKNTLNDVGLNDIKKDMHLLVRTSATSKKLSSKVKDITVKFIDKPSAAGEITAEGGDVITGIKVETKVPYELSKGAKITNTTADEYEFYLSPSGDEIENPKWTKLKAQGVKKSKPVPTIVSLKYSKDGKNYTYTDDNNKTVMFIRRAGKKQVGNEVTLPSAPLKVALKLAKATQTVVLSGEGSPSGTSDATATINTASPGKTYKIGFKVTKIYSLKAPSLKVKVTQKADGVSLKGGKFVISGSQVGDAKLEVKLAKNIFKKADKAVVKADYSVEGVKGTITITINKN